MPTQVQGDMQHGYAIRPITALLVWFCAGMCSAAVAALIALITPLPYSADFRPYFTIHDPAFAHLAAQELPSNTNGLPRVLGVTNLYFLKVSMQPCRLLQVSLKLSPPARACASHH